MDLDSEKRKSVFGFWPLKLAMFVLAGAALITLVLWQVRIADKRAELDALNQQIAVQQTRNEEIRREVDALDTQEGMRSYVERKAREDLDFARPDERVFVDVGGGS